MSETNLPTTSQDIETLCHLETMFQEYGFEDGFRAGEQSGELEGRIFGCEQAFEFGGEIGYYSGCADAWIRLAEIHPDNINPKALKNISALQMMIKEFPEFNCHDTDLLALRDKLKNKFRVITSLLGVDQKYSREEQPAMTY